MKIEIWSDIMCPFCYIGKRHLEAALSQFPDVPFELEWKSFQLDPTIIPQADKNVYEYLAERKGMSVEESKEMHAGVVARAAEVGLDYHFEKAVVSNSFDAHRVIQLAKTKGLGDTMEETFFKAYFTEGRNLNDKNTLMELGVGVGLNALDVKEVLEDEAKFADAVRSDISEAQQIGVRGVPFFVFDRKYAISGAQPIEHFEQTIREVLKAS
ncbi:DsbA family oxidoreductase [Fluviicola chungangensis]|jgi:protein disulfide-isomerase|uniref:DsbA family oxidoreductase n=1 Tax=Fluviicola chungangensis TaxID=2597671 RepID=A0A556MJD3_9FLAO|nr:DsbA family oxidoreductase [Fluviicola chungangensis]TSJ40017.1 DsbA family oxidoreductase [Fluviicola chungangensis]